MGGGRWSLLFAVVLVLVLFALLLSHFLLPSVIPLRLVLLVAVSDIIGLSITAISGQAFQAFEQMKWTAWYQCFFER